MYDWEFVNEKVADNHGDLEHDPSLFGNHVVGGEGFEPPTPTV